MEQLHTAHIDIDKAEEQQTTIELPVSLEINLNSGHNIKVESIPENRENIEKSWTEIVTDVSSVANNIKEEASSIKIEEDIIIEPPNNDLVRETKDKTLDNDPKVNNNKCIENEQVSEETHIIEESIEIVEEAKCIDDLSPCEGESTTCLTKSKSHKGTENVDEQDVCTITGTDVTDNSSTQCQAPLELLQQNCEEKAHPSCIESDRQLTKLVDGSAEVVVLKVETTVPVTNSYETTGENIVAASEKDAVGSNENKLHSVQDREDKKTDIVNDEFDIIDYSQESDGTIIEVISTEVVHTETPELCTRQESKEFVQSINSETGTSTPITSDPAEVVKADVDNSSDIKCTRTKENVSCNAEDVVERTQREMVEPQHCDSGEKEKINEELAPSQTVISPMPVDNPNKDNVCVSEGNKAGTAVKKRSVIQDIFDDWGDENAEDDSQAAPKVQDTVEIELENLLEDRKCVQSVNEEEETIIIVKEKVPCMENEAIANATRTAEIEETKESYLVNEQTTDQNVTMYPQNAAKGSSKEQVNVPAFQSQGIGLASKSMPQGTVAFNQASPPHATPILSRGRNLISQIASSAEVTEALKERLREQQKLVEPPRGPDIFFVKKLTQRLSSKLAGGPVTPMPALIPLPQSSTNNTTTQLSTNNGDRKSTDNTNLESNKESNSDNKELLAILEGDVDPDWSNLKPPTLTEEAKGPINIENDGHNTPPKLDPLVERELALKQLLELPVTPLKKIAPRKKKTFKPAPSKVGLSKETEVKDEPAKEKEIVNIDLIDGPESPKKNLVPPKTDVLSMDLEEQSTERSAESVEHDVRVDESRSGRKRKPTEKAREHEQNSTKRQKVYKGKIFVNKKQTQENDGVLDTSTSTSENHVANDTTLLSISTENAVHDSLNVKEVTDKQSTCAIDPISSTPENSSVKRPKQNLTRKGPQPISKRKIVAKKLLRQNMSPNKKPVKLKSKLSTSPKKSGSKIVPQKSQKPPKSQKRAAETTSGDAKPKKKIINEIDRLLQDEGVVNLLYDVEQPDKKRLVPITKSHAKVMDIQKVQRELKIRKKLVRNAVLRLRTTTSGVSKVSPRSKRAPSAHVADTRMDKKAGEQTPPLKIANANANTNANVNANAASSQEFIIPAKIRNAADASIIIRRHSSSSFSSASGSPRVSIDGADKFEGTKFDEGASHSLRSTKRRHSQDERINVKKSKKKAVQKVEAEAAVANIVEDKVSPSTRPYKKSDSKRSEKNSKQVDANVADETNNLINSSKVVTRSNGTTTGKVTSKNKKTAKSKVTFAKTCEPDNDQEPSKEEDELSACLAEAATALSVVNAANRSGNSAANRKNKANANNTKTTDSDNSKGKTEVQSQFSNKEINVRRHGNLVQLILTPSSPTKIRNALTLQMMHEFRETLSILKKDDDCRVVLLTSTGTSFCEGLELSTLLHTNKEERRVRAQELADTVKDFIKSLATFNKPIVAGVQGAAIGLGVTMLPLFDLVIASDKATFSTPYGKLGQIAEGAAVFTLSHILGSAITSELLLGGRTLTASEALRAGLVTRVLWPDRFQVELLPTLRAMSDQSAQSMEATKTLLRHSLRRKLDAALESETYLLIQHWCSAECQTAIKSYIDGKVQ